MNKIKILIADDVEETRKVIKKLLNLEKELFEVVGEAGDGEQVLELIPKVKPDIVLMDINMPLLNGLEATEKITSDFPSVIVIIMSVQSENEYLKKAMFHGAKEYINKPFNYDSLVNTIKATYEKHRERQIKQEFSNESKTSARIMTFFSSKGGVGKSVLALNSSIVISRELNKRVLLLDMDLQFGDIALLINQYNQKNIMQAVDDGQIDSYEGIKSYLYKYSENLDILFAPDRPEAAEYINKDIIEKVISSLNKQYDFIIIDTGVNYSDSTLCILDAAETILYVSTMEIASLKNTKLGLRVMQSLGYDKSKVKLVINRCTESYGISKEDVVDVFKDNILAIIPDEEKVVSTSVNKGEPFCNTSKLKKLKIFKVILGMCKSIVNNN